MVFYSRKIFNSDCPALKTEEYCCRLWLLLEYQAIIAFLVDKRTLATFRKAELGFLGVIV